MRSLKTILERENQEDLELFASDYLEEHFTSKKETIRYLEEKIKDEFAIFMDREFNFDYLDVLNEVKKNSSSNSILEDELIDRFFLFFKDDDNLEFPKELNDILQEKFNKAKQIQLLKAVVICYVDINNVIPVEFFQKNYIEKYSLDITIEDLNLEYPIRNGLILISDANELEEFYNLYKQMDYRILSNEQLFKTFHVHKDLLTYIEKIIKNKEKISKVYAFLTFKPMEDPNDVLGSLVEYFSINKKQAKMISSYYLDIAENIRFAALRGRNLNDSFLDTLKKEAAKIKSKEEFTLDKFIELTDLVNETHISKEDILESYNEITDIDELILEIIESEDVCYDTFDPKFLVEGKIGIALVNDEYKYLMPNELRRIVEKDKRLSEKLQKKYKDDFYEITYSITNYIQANGIISKEKLIELLKKTGIKLNENELNEIIEYKHLSVIENYIVDPIFDQDSFDYIKNEKAKKDDYKIFDLDELINLKNEIEATLLQNDIEPEECIIDDIYYEIQFAIFNKKELKKILLEHEILINSKKLNEIYKELESLSMIAPLWKLNGFSKNELN